MKEIIIRPIYLERAAYWLIILILLFTIIKSDTENVLNGFGTLEDDLLSNYNNTNNTENLTANLTDNTSETPEPEEEIIEETCEDGIKNQDETQIDCGGVCEGYYYDEACHDDPKPIVRLTFNLDSASWEYGSGDETNARLSSVTLTIDNGLATVASGYKFQVYVYDDDDLDYIKTLNQVGGADDYITIMDIAKEAKITKEFEFSGKLFSNLGNKKSIDVKIYDSGENLITSESLFLDIE